MIKRELRALRSLYATREMVEKAKTLTGKKYSQSYNWHTNCIETIKHEYMYAYYGRVQNLEGYVKVALFNEKDLRQDIRTPFAEIFLDPANRDYITREWDKDGSEKWRSCKIDSVISFYSHWYYSNNKYDETCWFNRDALKTIKTVLGTEKKGVDGILQFQQGVRADKIKEKDKRITDAWDEEMATIPKAPEAFYDWIKKDCISKHYLFYDTDKKKGYCSRCDKYVDLKTCLPVKKYHPAHNKDGECPECGRKIIYKHVNRMSCCLSTSNQYGNGAELIQYNDGRIIARRFSITLRYRGKGWESVEHPIWDIRESERYIRGPEYIHRYEFTNWKSKGMRWAQEMTGWRPFATGRIYYEGSRSDRAKVMRFSVLPKILNKNKARYQYFNVFSYIVDEKNHPIIEQLYKAGCKRLYECASRDMLQGNWIDESQTSLIGKLQLDNMRFKRLLKADGGKFYFLWLRQEKQDNTIYADSFIRDMEKHQIFPGDLDRIPLEMSYLKKFNYIRRQTSMNTHEALTEWRDYLTMAGTLKMDLANSKLSMPKDLHMAHQQLVDFMERGKVADQAKKLKKKYKNLVSTVRGLTKYEYSGEEFCIVAPKKVEDIINEGISLGHCVHTCEYYWERMNVKETYILFLRRKDTPEVPWYTLEVEPSGNIRQKRTTGDRQNKDLKSANTFLREWQKEIQKRLSKEDKTLAKKSDLARKKEYKDLRANGNRVWHGVLQGKLLADVLENDFMPVIDEEECLQKAAGR